MIALCLLLLGVQGQSFSQSKLTQAEIDQIIKKFSENEAANRNALKTYAYLQDLSIQTLALDVSDKVTGEYRRQSKFRFDENGNQIENIIYFPKSTIFELIITPKDIEDFDAMNFLALTPQVVSQYSFSYIGREMLDELDSYVFDISPKIMPDPKKSSQRFFMGRIWVDDRDLVIVRTKGKSVPDIKENKHPNLDVYRENIEGKYWLPSRLLSDEVLNFDSGRDFRIKIRVKYINYITG